MSLRAEVTAQRRVLGGLREEVSGCARVRRPSTDEEHMEEEKNIQTGFTRVDPTRTKRFETRRSRWEESGSLARVKTSTKDDGVFD